MSKHSRVWIYCTLIGIVVMFSDPKLFRGLVVALLGAIYLETK